MSQSSFHLPSLSPSPSFAPGALRLAVAAAFTLGVPAAWADDDANPATLPPVKVSGERAAGSSLSLDEPVDAGSRLGLSARETPASLSRMDSAEVADRGITRVQEAVVRLPGFSSAAGAGNGGTALTARGFTGPGSVVQMIDGTRLVVGAGTVSFPVSTWPIETVEGLRGPASVLFGDGAIGGAVNYVTKRPLTQRTEREAYATVGTQDTYRAGVGGRGPINEQWAYAAYLNTDRQGGYIDRTDTKLNNYSGTLQYQPDGRLKLSLSADGSHQDGVRYRGTPVRNSALDPRVRRTSFNVDDSDLVFSDRWLRANAEYKVSDDFKLRNEVYHLSTDRHFRDVQNYAYTSPGVVNRSRYVDILHHQRQVGDRLDGTLDGQVAGLKNRLTVGVEVYRVHFSHVNNSELNGSTYAGSTNVDPLNVVPGLFSANPRATVERVRTTMDSQGLFLEDALDLTKSVKLVTGLRKDHTSIDSVDPLTGVPAARTYTPLTGRAGLVWTLNPALTLYTQYATGTDPAASQLTLSAANQTFDLATGRQLEVGAKGNMDLWRGEWTLAAYRIEKKNLLSSPANGPQQQIGEQSAQGLEAALALAPARGWTVDLNAAVLQARYDRFDEIVAGVPVSRAGMLPTNTPERMLNLWTAYRFAPKWRAGAGLQHVGARSGDNANLTHVPAYTVFDAALHYEMSKQVQWDLALRNLGNKAYAVSSTNNGNQWILGDPRSVELTARFKF